MRRSSDISHRLVRGGGGAFSRAFALLPGPSVVLFVASALLQVAGSNTETGGAHVHVRCAEHGQLTHAASAPVGANQLPQPSASGLPVARGNGAPDADAHEHCPYAAVLDQPAPTLSSWASAAHDDVAPPSPPLLPDDGRLHPGRLVLDSAPKTSPPLG